MASSALASKVAKFNPVFLNNGPCTSTARNCEAKSYDSVLQSSEATYCDNSAGVSDVYLPSPKAGIPYLTLNAYVGNSCGNFGTQVTQRTFAADGECHVFEPGYYFRAACTESQGQLQFCSYIFSNLETARVRNVKRQEILLRRVDRAFRLTGSPLA